MRLPPYSTRVQNPIIVNEGALPNESYRIVTRFGVSRKPYPTRRIIIAKAQANVPSPVPPYLKHNTAPIAAQHESFGGRSREIAPVDPDSSPNEKEISAAGCCGKVARVHSIRGVGFIDWLGVAVMLFVALAISLHLLDVRRASLSIGFQRSVESKPTNTPAGRV